MARLLVRGRTGSAGPVHTSLAQGGLVPMAMHWQRAETPSPSLAVGNAEEQHHGDAVRVRRRRVDPPHGQNRAVAVDAGGHRRDRVARRWCRRSKPAPSDPVTRVQVYIDAFLRRPSKDWLEDFWAHDVPVQPAVPFGEILQDEQSRARTTTCIDLDDPVAGRITVPGLPLTITPPARVQHAAPELGAHTDEVLASGHRSRARAARDGTADRRRSAGRSRA